MVRSTVSRMADVRINVAETVYRGPGEATLYSSTIPSCHIPRPSFGGKRDTESGSWKQHLESPSRSSTSSQGSTASTHSAASGTLLLTAANLASLAAIHPPRLASTKEVETASVASSTHFTVINGLSRPYNDKKSWCARNQLTVLVTTMSLLFMVGLLAAILYMEIRARDKYN